MSDHIKDGAKVGSEVEVTELTGNAMRSLGGESSVVRIGDRGMVVEIFGESASGRIDDLRVISKRADDSILWEANFVKSELRVVQL